jgi:eukaryotic-like serine/threonine-protein kinase
MTPERWEQINDLYLATLDLERGEQATFLRRACDGDAALREEVTSLIAAHDRAGNFLAEPALQVAARVLAQDSASSLVGRTLSHYRIESLLGAGGMGAVYVAEDTKLDRQVAVKVLHEDFGRQETNVDRFVQEAKAASALNHPNILVIHEIGVSEEANYIVSELIEGRTLRDVISESRLKTAEVLEISIQIASALCAAHEANLVHSDIKPENIMIRPNGHLKLLDFGLAKLIERRDAVFSSDGHAGDQIGSSRGVMGTVRYMSPEQARGDRVDERTDIFSLGVVMHEMLAGETPFGGDSVSERIANLLNAAPPPLSRLVAGVPNELQRIVSKTLRKEREERYQTSAALLVDLKSLRENLQFDERLERSAWRRKLSETSPLLRSALVAAVLAMLGVGGYLWSRPEPAIPGAGKVPSIAVLPLKPIATADRDQIYEMGIADSLILTLSSMEGLVVRPLSATRKYADLRQDPLAAGREQKVDYVLASNYQLVRGKIRVTSQLFNVATGRIEKTYKGEKDAADIFAMEDSIAGEVGKMLSTRFSSSRTPAASRGTTNEEAYRFYLQGMYFYDNRIVADSRKAVEYLNASVRLDPDYARAWAGKAHAHRAVANRARSIDIHHEYRESMEATHRALALDPNLPDAHSALCENKAFYEWDFEGAERECNRAIEISPNSALAHQVYSRFLDSRGRHDEAIDEIKTAIDLEPASRFSQFNYALSLFYARSYPEAVAQFQRVVGMDPNFEIAYPWIWTALELQGNESEAFEWWLKWQVSQKADERSLQRFRALYRTSGWHGVMADQARRFENSEIVHFHVACWNARLGNSDMAFEHLEKSLQRREFWITRLKVDPRLDSLRGDARFEALIRRVGL